MSIDQLIEKAQTDVIPLGELATVAADRRCAGEDVLDCFKAQLQKRIGQAESMLDAAKAESRDLHASEQRAFERAIREQEAIQTMLRGIEQRTADSYRVPETQSRSLSTPTTRAGLFGVELRALVENTGAGGVIVPDQFSAQFFDKLSAESAGLRSGFRRITASTDTLRIPTVDSDPTAAWTSEAGTISPADPGYTELVATPRKLAALTRMSNELIADSNPSVLELLELQLARALALKLDLGFFEGSGSAPEIRGLKNVAGISTVSMGTNGAAFTNLDPFADAIGALEALNARSTAIVMHPRSWKSLIKLKEQTASNNKPLLQDSAGSGAAGVQRAIYGVPVYLSSQLSITETQGTSGAVCSSAYVIQADQCVAVFRSDARIELDRSRLFNSDESELRAVLRADLVVPNPEGVCRILGIL
jgi:HK97 family phage major capsid protein